MNLDFFFVFANLISLFLLIAAGYAAMRLHMIPDHASPVLSALLMRITLPATIFISLATKQYDPGFLSDSIAILLIGFPLYGGMLLLFYKIAEFIHVQENHRGLWAFGVAFSNNGFMGFPIILALLGSDGLALAVVYNIAFNLTLYTIGVVIISRDSTAENQGIDLKKTLLSEINLAVLLSLIFYLGRIPLLSFTGSALTQLSNITTPLSMFITGMALAGNSGRALLTDRDAYSCAISRLLLHPIATLLLLRLIPELNPLIFQVVILTAAMPTPGVMTVLAESYHSDLRFAAKASFVSNILSIATIPLICLLL